MKETPKGSKRRPKLVESFNNVPNILEKARQAVDEVTQSAAPPSRKAKPAVSVKSKTPVPKKAAKASGRPKKAARPPKQPAAAAVAATPPPQPEPLLGLAACGISVKHALPGRVRLRLSKMLHNEALADKLPPLLATVPGVTAAEASTATGSLLITFSSRELAGAQGRQELGKVLHQFFPGLDTETLVQRLLRA